MEDEELDESIEIGDADASVESLLSKKEAERVRLKNEVEAFIKNGGIIRQIEANVVADPPKKPESNYGGQPI